MGVATMLNAFGVFMLVITLLVNLVRWRQIRAFERNENN